MLDQAGAEWRDLEQAVHAKGAARPPWPPTPGLYAQAVRSAIEYASDDSELRLVLMELAIAIVVTEYVDLCSGLLRPKRSPGCSTACHRHAGCSSHLAWSNAPWAAGDPTQSTAFPWS